MSVDRTDYVIYGYKIDPKQLRRMGVNIHDDKHERMLCGHKEEKYRIVDDQMSGEYVVFGKLIANSDTYTGFKMTQISYQDFFDDDEIEEIKNRFIGTFGFNPEVVDVDDEPQMIIFTHYS